MILLIDNYDSFSFNLYQMIGEINEDILVIRNDEMTINEIFNLNPSHIIISPGPGHPKDAGIIEELIKANKKIPLLGVCLGHQAICEAFGSRIGYAKNIMHGKKDKININNNCLIFNGLDSVIDAARYHSLIGYEINNDLEIIASNSDNEVMGVKHKIYPIYGVQFHPESILTNDGFKIIKNFLGSGNND